MEVTADWFYIFAGRAAIILLSLTFCVSNVEYRLHLLLNCLQASLWMGLMG
uniref:Uncharacterized protein n=1 Tax=Arundo donax TaxID=35708 RepID=A0A0A9EBI6_ARUDO